MEQITSALPNVAKLETRAGQELLAQMLEQMQGLRAERDNALGQVVNLAVENASMLSLLTDISENHGEFVNEADDYMYASVPLDYVSEINMYVSRDVNAENPFAATDAALANIQAQYRAEGINFSASRLCAAYNHGFIDKPMKEVADVVRMILDAKEELSGGPLLATDGLSGEYAEKFLEECATQLRKGAAE